MEFKGTIIITDPCYVIKEDEGRQDDWDMCECGDYMEALGIKHYISEPTIYGDWSCTTWSTPRTDVISQVEELSELYDKFYKTEENSEENKFYEDEIMKETSALKSIGNFCADAGMVAVFLLDEILKYNPDFSNWVEEHPWRATVIPDFEGDVKYHIDKDGDAHIIGKGNINFFTSQTGL